MPKVTQKVTRESDGEKSRKRVARKSHTSVTIGPLDIPVDIGVPAEKEVIQ
jgi:hypothetical protein